MSKLNDLATTLLDLGCDIIDVDATGVYFDYVGAEGFATLQMGKFHEKKDFECLFRAALSGEANNPNILTEEVIHFWVDTPEGDLGFVAKLETLENDLKKFKRIHQAFNLADELGLACKPSKLN